MPIDAVAALDVFCDVSEPCRMLARRDPVLRRALKIIGEPVIRRRAGGFEGLFRIIVEQQVSVASAQAIWARCVEAFGTPTPAAVLGAGEAGLTALGLSRPKARYVLALAEALSKNAFCFNAVQEAGDDAAAEMLIAQKGVGPWSAAIYLLFCEGRVDIWPRNDVALLAAFTDAAGLDERPAMTELDAASEAWRTYRGVAAHILWTYYAVRRGRTPI
ncbi:MAG: DNA-3-methyladenine glycosylase 2 family protein [Pseudomonadota bacterium]